MIPNFLEVLPKERLLIKENMERHTTFKIGGPADYYALVEAKEELRGIISMCKEASYPYFILGNGSNVLISDQGYRGIVIHLSGSLAELRVEGTKIYVGGGCMLSKVGMAAIDASLSGLEWGTQIPGTMGGAIRMNAGAYGGEIKNITASVTLLNENGEFETLTGEEMAFGYRRSILAEKEGIVVEVVLNMERGDRDEIRKAVTQFGKQRLDKQPLEYPSAGSTFKRPEGYFAGKLIQDAGLAGYSVGGARVSEKHCGFVINENHATAAEVRQLIRDVQRIVYEKFQVRLEPEVLFIGNFF